MSFLFWLRRLFSLDTLDTRFTVSSTTPLKVAGDSLPERNDTRTDRVGGGSKAESSGKGNGEAGPKWWTREFILYYAILSFAIPMMFKAAIEVSRGRFPPRMEL